jgi:hypothetical protein
MFGGIGFLDCLHLWISGWKWFDRRNELTISARIEREVMKGLRDVYGVPSMRPVDGSVNGLHELNADYVEAKNERWDTSLSGKALLGEDRAVFQSTSPTQRFILELEMDCE